MRRAAIVLTLVLTLATGTYASEQLPQLPKVVAVEVKFVEVNASDLLRYGLSWDSLSLRFPIRNEDGSIFPQPNEIWFGASPSGILSTILQAMHQRGTANILSSVTVLASHETQTVMTLTEDIPVAISQELQSGIVVRSIQVFQVGFTLVVIPRIMDGWVDLQMRPSLRIITGHTPDGTPQIATRAVEMRVPVREGHTLTVAQMIDQRTIKTVSGIPIMSRIPIIGVLFRTTRNTTTESGLTIFVTPKVMP